MRWKKAFRIRWCLVSFFKILIFSSARHLPCLAARKWLCSMFQIQLASFFFFFFSFCILSCPQQTSLSEPEHSNQLLQFHFFWAQSLSLPEETSCHKSEWGTNYPNLKYLFLFLSWRGCLWLVLRGPTCAGPELWVCVKWEALAVFPQFAVERHSFFFFTPSFTSPLLKSPQCPLVARLGWPSWLK